MYHQLGNLAIHYQSFGEGEPILILPGWGINAEATAQYMEAFFQDRHGWQRIYLDPPGHGKTSATADMTGLDDILHVVVDFINQVIGDQQFLLVGISLGAYLARGVLFFDTHRIAGLAMIVPVILADDTQRQTPSHIVLEEDPALLAELSPEEVELFEIIVVRSRAVLDELRKSFEHLAQAPGDGDFRNQIRMDPTKYAFGFDVDTLAQPFDKPALFITGRQDTVVGYQDAWNILADFPRATFAVLDRAGHLTEEKETLIKALMWDWLDRVERASARED